MDIKNSVGFYLETSFHYLCYETIIDALVQKGIPCCLVIGDEFEAALVDDLVAFIASLKRDDVTVIPVSVLRQSKEKLSLVVGVYYRTSFDTIAHRLVRIVYGLAKEAWNFAWWNVFFEKILCYGAYAKERLNLVNNCAVVGNPRFDRWHRSCEWNDLSSILPLNPNKPTLLYAPTYGPLSSIEAWAERLSRLQSDYNLIVKLHHRTVYAAGCSAQHDRAHACFQYILPQVDLTLDALRACDYVLSDHSGFIFDAIHAETRVILLASDAVDAVLKRGEDDSNPDSSDMKIRAYLPVARNIDRLHHFLSPHYPWSQHSAALDRIRHDYCDPYRDGKAGLRAAQCIIDLLHTPPACFPNDLGTSLRHMLRQSLVFNEGGEQRS